jgi:sodium-coupled monocarboxylate transporter 8/12
VAEYNLIGTFGFKLIFTRIFYAVILFICSLVFSVSFDPRVRHTVWSLLIGGTLNSLTTYGFNQTQVQRYMCVRTTRGAKQALFINAIGAVLIILFSGLIGIILYAYYADCDPYTAGYVTDIDQIFPYFVMEVLSDKPGLPGVFLACIFSGSLSTISSGLNSLAAVIIEDIYKGLLGRKLTDERQGFVSKIFSVVLGAIVMVLTYVVSYLGSILNAALSLFGVLSGPIMGVFFLGFFFPRANRRGGLIGFLTSLGFQLWLFLGAQITKNQMKSERLPLSIANCMPPINKTITTPASFK